MMDMGHHLHLIDLLAKLYRKQLAKVKIAGTRNTVGMISWYERSPTRLCPFPVRVQHPIGDVTNLRCADDIILLATLEAEL